LCALAGSASNGFESLVGVCHALDALVIYTQSLPLVLLFALFDFIDHHHVHCIIDVNEPHHLLLLPTFIFLILLILTFIVDDIVILDERIQVE